MRNKLLVLFVMAMVSACAAGAETLLAAPAAGVYTVRVGSQPARRIVLTH